MSAPAREDRIPAWRYDRLVATGQIEPPEWYAGPMDARRLALDCAAAMFEVAGEVTGGKNGVAGRVKRNMIADRRVRTT